MTLITAIVPTYNRAELVSETLECLAAQTNPVHEVLVWDDGSTDNTEAVVRAAPGPIRYFRSKNGGKSKALNDALKEAKGDLIWICDDDDLAMPNAAEILTKMLADAPNAGAAAGSYMRFRDDPVTGERVKSGPGYWPDLSQGSVLRHLLEDMFLFQNATLVRREIYDQVGPFREDLARSIDYDMAVRLAINTPIVVTGEPLFLQRKHEGVRGPERERHSAARSDAVWKEADRVVFSEFRDKIPLTLYTGLFDGPLAPRAALLQRACVYARRTDWVAAMADLEAAACLEPTIGLSPLEQAICRRAMAGKHGVAEVLEVDMQRQLAELARSGPVAAEITTALVRGMRWRAREALLALRIKEAVSVARFGLALKSAGRVHHPPIAHSPLLERRDLPIHKKLVE